ncbi:hypothetical protein LINPERPRIM_LOCUS21934 [Linum perenne]
MVGQFSGSAPPLLVIKSMSNRLWGYEGQVNVSELETNFYLFEFALEKLRDWVIGRSWHIHRAPLVLRKWHSGIAPLDLSQECKPIWIRFEKIPPVLMTPKGISWLATQFGKPINKFVRYGLSVNVCVLKRPNARDSGVMKVDIGQGEPAEILASVLAERSYDRVEQKVKKRWEVRVPIENGKSKVAPEVRIHSEPLTFPQQTTFVEISSTSGNEAKSSAEEEASPGKAGFDHLAGGGTGNEAEIPKGMDASPVQGSVPEAVIAEEDTLSPSEDSEDSGEIERVQRGHPREATLGDFIISPAKGRVLTRQQQNRRR